MLTLAKGVGGGAWYPPAQGALADRASTRRSYLVPMTGYLTMLIYAVYVHSLQTLASTTDPEIVLVNFRFLAVFASTRR